MLPMVVIVMAGAYLLLHYAGAFEAVARRTRGSGKGRSPGRAVERELEKRLQVFEDFLEKGAEPDDEPPAG